MGDGCLQAMPMVVVDIFRFLVDVERVEDIVPVSTLRTQLSSKYRGMRRKDRNNVELLTLNKEQAKRGWPFVEMGENNFFLFMLGEL